MKKVFGLRVGGVTPILLVKVHRPIGIRTMASGDCTA
jgi:hypothetical protein